ncbi:response regulator [bacterium]|nr:response regulator [bacterium]
MSKIFVVEDEKNLRTLYKAEIEEMGHEVVCLANGREAYKRVQEELPDLIVLDLMMPEGDGLDFLTRLLDSRMHIPVIINSAYTHYKNDYISMAAEAYVIKSSDLTELKAHIIRVLGQQNMASA